MLITTTEAGTPAQMTENDLVDQIDVSRVKLNDEREATPEPLNKALFSPKSPEESTS
jgi:hypothetical protein